MIAGTPGFYGERLVEIREARGLTMLQLGELVGVTKQAIGMYEKSRASPSPETLERLTQVLRVPARYFLRPPTPPPGGAIYYRSLAAATQRVRTRAERKMDWVREVLKYLSCYVELPTINIPNYSPPADPHRVTAEMIDEVASSLRRHWELGEGVISNVALLLENNGIVASRFELESEQLDSFSLWDDYTQRPLLILGKEKQSAVRSRLDAAHELAHLALHRNVPMPALKDRETHSLMENQAFQFARAFLLPAQPFARDFALPTLNALKNLKKKWKASIGLMIKRAHELDLITEEQAQRLWVNRTRQGWNKREPFDDEMEPEQPVLLARSIRLLVESKTVGVDDLLSAIPLSAEDIETVAVLPPGFLTSVDESLQLPEPRLLRFPDRTTG